MRPPLPLRPRALTHRGVVSACGFLFDPELTGTEAAHRRLLSLWSPDARVLRVPEGLLLLLSSPVAVRCDRAPGLPLVAAGPDAQGPLVSAPVSAAELERLAPRAGAVVLVREGDFRVYHPADLPREDPADWLEVGDLQPVAAETLGRWPEPRMVAEPRGFDPRKHLPGVPAPAAELLKTLGEMREAARKREEAAQARAAGRQGEQEILTSGSAPLLGLQMPPVGDGLRRLFDQVMHRSGLAGAIHRKHAEYMRRLLEMFEKGDLHNALRHALPLNELPPPETGAYRPFYGFLKPRANLDINPFRGAFGGSSLFSTEDFFSHLRELYRQAHLRLEAEGRIEEAAFVLAELLDVPEEAVAFLEKHGRFRLAAELAEGRKLAPELIVRQWFLAGDADRAIAVARRTGAFAGAVTRLEKTYPDQAKALRLYWAETLADAGDYSAAVEAAWPVEEARLVTVVWLDRAIEGGGATAGRMLVRKLALLPELEEPRARARALLEDDRPENAATRLAFASALRRESFPGARRLARTAVRALLADAVLGHARVPVEEVRELARYSEDGALRTDLPPHPNPPEPPLSNRTEPLVVEVEAGEAGTLPVYDAAVLPDGRIVAALGEAGVRVLSREGAKPAHFDQPAERLVLSDHGDRAIALAGRGRVTRLSKLDFRTLRAEEWALVPIDAAAADYDGSLWFIGSGRELLAVDVLSSGFDVLWRDRDVGGKIEGIARHATRLSVLVHDSGRTDAWGGRVPAAEAQGRWECRTYEVPSLTLRLRTEPRHASEVYNSHRAVSPGGHAGEIGPSLHRGGPDDPTTAVVFAYDGAVVYQAQVPLVMRQVQATMNESWAALTIDHDGEAPVEGHLLTVPGGRGRARVLFHGRPALHARLQPEHALFMDRRGRVVILPLEGVGKPRVFTVR